MAKAKTWTKSSNFFYCWEVMACWSEKMKMHKNKQFSFPVLKLCIIIFWFLLALVPFCLESVPKNYKPFNLHLTTHVAFSRREADVK